MVAYLMDAMRYKEGSFLAVWMSLALANLSMGYTTLFLDNDYSITTAILGVFLNSGVLFLTGSWATVQFKWIQIQYPAVIVAFEKMLMTSCLPTAGAVLYWGLIIHNGIETAPYLISVVLSIMYASFARPLPSSFLVSPHQVATGGAPVQLGSIQRPLDGALSFVYVSIMPVAAYFAAHNAVILSWTHMWSMMLLSCGPLLAMSAIPNGLWWLGSSAASDTVAKLMVLVSFAGVLAGIEGRIVFHSFGQYIKLAPPWSYIAITLAVYGVGAIVLLHLSGMMGEETASLLMGPITMVSAAIGSLVMGVPIWALPAPLVAAAGVSLCYESKSLRDYTLIIVGGLASGAWFLWQHFWFLDIELDGFSLRTMCILIFVSMVPALLIPGLIMAKLPGTSPLIIMQAVIIAVLEEHLYSGDYLEVTYNIHPMFPASLVVFTSVTGIFIARKLKRVKIVTNVTGFILECIYGAKIAMIFVPETRMAIPVIIFALSSLHPLFLGNTNGALPRKFEAWKGLLMAFAVFLAVAAARFAIFDALYLVLDRKPSEALAAGSLLLAFACGLFPMVSTYYRDQNLPKRVTVLMASLGLLLVLLRPPLPIKGGAECPKLPLALCPRLWDASHTPEHEQDDVAVYGDGLRRREHWPLWFIVSASFFGILAATSKIAENATFAPLRLIQGGVAGLLVGGYMSLEFFPGMFQVQVLITTSCLLVAFLVVLLSVPSKGSAILTPLLGTLWMGLFPATFFVLSISSLPPLPQDMVRLHPDIADLIPLNSLRWNTLRVSMVACFAAQTLIVSFAAKLRLGASRGKSRSGPAMLGAASDALYIDKAAEFLGGYVQSSVNQATMGSLVGKKYKTLQSVGMSYLPEACNFITLVCYCLCLWVNRTLDGDHKPFMILILSSILLLLGQDSSVLKGLTENRRYFPPYAVGAGALTFEAITHILGDTFSLDDGFYMDIDPMYLLINVGAVVLSLPSILEMIDYLWTERQPSKLFLSVTSGILASCAIFITSVEPVRVLAGLSGITAAILSASSQQKKQFNSRML
jgi:hypothetical protein